MRLSYYLAAGLAATIGITGTIGRWFTAVDPRILPAAEVDYADAYSNILPDDYVGPAACAACHTKQHSLWQGHSHSRMNQLPGEDSVLGDYSSAVLRLGDSRVAFSQRDGAYLMDVERHARPLRSYQITRTVGSRVMQFYIGRQLTGPEARDGGHAALYGEHMLPFVYSFKLGQWLPKAYFDPDGPDELADGRPLVEGVDRIRDVRPYSMICMNCHNTYPYAYRIFHPEFCGFPDARVRGAPEQLSTLLSPTAAVEPTVESFLGLNGRLDPDRHLVTLGISCESCHFGGREHALAQRRIRFAPASPYLRLASLTDGRPVESDRHNPATINGICVQCHSGHARLFPNGAATSNSREGLDMLAGSCVSRMSCVDCHEPHTAEGPAGRVDSPRHVAACIRCHDRYADPPAAAAHSRHSTEAGVSCLDCHMPRWSQGLDELVRTHRVSAPVEESMVAAGSANACNLCHLNKSVRWTLAELARGWGQRLEPRAEWAERYGGSLDNPVGRAWLAGDDTAMRLVAAQCYARSPLGASMLPSVLQGLNDPEPINRLFALFAIQRITGKLPRPRGIDITAGPVERERAVQELRAALSTRTTSDNSRLAPLDSLDGILENAD